MNVQMWIKALKIMPQVSKDEWDRLDIVSRWLVATRAAALVTTVTAAVIAGLLAAIDGRFSWWRFVLVLIGLYFAHGTNNLVNDLTDSKHGVDKDNYFRTQYGPQPLETGLLTKGQMYKYIGVSGAIAAVSGIVLILTQQASTGGSPWLTLILMAIGAVFVLFYTYPLKFIALGELTIFLVWGPLMVAGGHYAITGMWSWGTVWAAIPYGLAVTAVIFGKHMDKRTEDREKHIHTLPSLISEKAGRISVMVMWALMYLLPVAYIWLVPQYFAWPMFLVWLTPLMLKKSERQFIWSAFTHPRPTEPPEEAKSFWPLWFVGAAMVHTRLYGGVLVLAMIISMVLKVIK
ncbi:MAG: prenyltransferase [Anaerolineaceae bacterium]